MNSSAGNFTVCTSATCHQLSNFLLSSLSPNYHMLSPCVNWDEYLCSGFRQKHEIQPYAEVNSSSIIKDEADNIVRGILLSDYSDIAHHRSNNGQGKSLRSHSSPISSLKTSGNVDEQNFNLMSQYYRSCIANASETDKDNQPFLDLMEEINKPFAPMDAVVVADSGDKYNTYKAAYNTSKKFNLEDSLMMRNAIANVMPLGISPFVTYSVQKSMKHPDVSAIVVSPYVKTGLPSKKWYSDDRAVREYRSFLCTFLYQAHGSHTNRVQAFFSLPNRIMELERRLLEIQPSPQRLSSLRDSVEFMTPSRLGRLLPQLLLNETVEQHPLPKTELVDHIEVVAPEYYWYLSKLLRNTAKETVRSYLLWQAFLQTQDLWQMGWLMRWRLLNEYVHGRNATSREEMCLAETKKNFGIIIDSFYARTEISKETKAAGEGLFEDVRDAYLTAQGDSMLWTLSRAKVMNMTRNMRGSIGYPESPDITDPEAIARVYAGAEIRSGLDTQRWEDDSEVRVHNLKRPEKWTFIHDYFNMERWKSSKAWGSLGGPIDKKAWTMNGYDAKLTYSTQRNELTFPGGLMRGPIFSKDAPGFANYGAAGVLMAKAMTHSFDDPKSSFLANGELGLDDWIGSERGELDKLQECIDADYSALNLERSNGEQRNMKLRTGGLKREAMADLTAIQVAYKAWKTKQQPDERLPNMEKFTPDQLFFLLRGSMFCNSIDASVRDEQLELRGGMLAEVRSRIPLKSTPEFSAAFGCDTTEYHHTCKGFY